MAPNKSKSATTKPKSSRPGQKGSVLASIKSSIQHTKDKLHMLRTSANSKIAKTSANRKTAPKPQHLEQVVERVSSTSNSPISNRPTPNTSPERSPSTPPHIPQHAPSTLTAQDFELGGPLGKGKFGHVYLARHISTNYICALKIISKAHCTNESEERLIRREIEVHQNLSHPNILKLFSWFHDAVSIYLVLEYAPGGNLYSRLKKAKNGRFEERVAAKHVAEVAAALKYMHDKNIMHRDIKPENILLGLHGEIKLADFGYSVHSASGLRSTVCGTLDYMSPEMAVMMLHPDKDEASYTKAIDRWSLGVLMYELVVGKAPFEMKSMQQTQVKIAKYRGKGIKFPEYVSEEARGLMRGLLTLEAEGRMGFGEVLAHPWIVGRVGESVKMA